MSKSVVEVEVRTVIPSGAGSVVFLGNGEKIMTIHVDSGVGAAIAMFMAGVQKERPLTHDLIGHILVAFGAKVERVIINDLQNGTFFARLILSAENQLMPQRKLMEIDARPSDCMALAIAHGAPLYVARDVFEQVEDMTEVYRKILENQAGEEPEPGPPEEEE